MRDTTVAARYARALFLVSEKRGETDRALADVHGLREVLTPGGKVAPFLATPEVRLADKRQALAAALKGRALPLAAVFVDLLLRKKRLPELPTVVEEFEALVEHARGIQRAQVVSATPLTRAESGRLQKELERWTGGTIRLAAAVDPELLGGAFVRIGDRVIDRSARTLLSSIARRLHEAAV